MGQLVEPAVAMVGRSWRPAYLEAVRQAGVIGLCSGDESAQQVADRLGVCRPTLYTWKDQLLGHGAPSSMKRRINVDGTFGHHLLSPRIGEFLERFPELIVDVGTLLKQQSG